MKKTLVNSIIFEVNKIKEKRYKDKDVPRELELFSNKNYLYKQSINTLLTNLCHFCRLNGFIEGVERFDKSLQEGIKEKNQRRKNENR